MARDPAQADRLAQALRANLRRRKAAAPPPAGETPRDPSTRESDDEGRADPGRR